MRYRKTFKDIIRQHSSGFAQDLLLFLNLNWLDVGSYFLLLVFLFVHWVLQSCKVMHYLIELID
jgi:hypothetical protein